MRAWLVVVMLSLAASGRAVGQSEAALRRYFEGKTVLARIDLPGTDDGVDVYPGTDQPVDFPKHATRLKRYGTAIRSGEPALVTKIRVKKDLIEFQLGGGGYGTFWDDDASVPEPTVSKSEREKQLERDLETATGAERQRIRDQLDRLRRDRERELARLRVEAEQARQIKEANIRQRRLEGGSRFNLRYRDGVPEDALYPDAVIAALEEYLSFEGAFGPTAEPASPQLVRKGLTEAEVSGLLGTPESLGHRMEGSLRVTTAVYHVGTKRYEMEFVEDVLIRYTIAER